MRNLTEVLSTLFNSSPEPGTYAHWHGGHLTDRGGESFLTDRFTVSSDTPPHIIRMIDAQLARQLGGKPEILKRETGSSKKIVSLDGDVETFEDYRQKSEESIADLFNHAGITEMIPITFHRLTPKKKVRASSSEGLHLYVAFQTFDVTHVRYDFIINGERRKAVFDLGMTSQQGGMIKSSTSVEMKGQGEFSFDEEESFILVTTGYDAMTAYTSPPAETLHYAMRDVRIRETKKDLEEEIGEVTEETMFDVFKIAERWLLREEAIIHALLSAYLHQHGKTLGFTSREIKKYSKANSHGHRITRMVEDKIRRLGAPAIVVMYQEEPRRLFYGK